MKMPKPIITFVRFPYILTEHLFGKDHTPRHRVSVGLVVMASGVMISKISFGYEIVHFLADGIGYLIHGIGCLPIIESLQEVVVGSKPIIDEKLQSTSIQQIIPVDEIIGEEKE